MMIIQVTPEQKSLRNIISNHSTTKEPELTGELIDIVKSLKIGNATHTENTE